MFHTFTLFQVASISRHGACGLGGASASPPPHTFLLASDPDKNKCSKDIKSLNRKINALDYSNI